MNYKRAWCDLRDLIKSDLNRLADPNCMLDHDEAIRIAGEKTALNTILHIENCSDYKDPVIILEEKTYDLRNVITFLLTEDVGMSANALISQLLLTNNPNRNYPHDCGDLGRCINAFKALGLKDISHMEVVSREWCNISKEWTTLLRLNEIDKSECYRVLKECII